jgi:hypothetical protein
MILDTIVYENDNKTNYVNYFHYMRSSLVFGEDKSDRYSLFLLLLYCIDCRNCVDVTVVSACVFLQYIGFHNMLLFDYHFIHM